MTQLPEKDIQTQQSETAIKRQKRTFQAWFSSLSHTERTKKPVTHQGRNKKKTQKNAMGGGGGEAGGGGGGGRGGGGGAGGVGGR